MTLLIKDTYIDFYRFLKNPINQLAEDQTFKNKVDKLFGVLVLEIPIIAIIGAIIYGIEKAGLIDIGSHKIDELFQHIPIWKFILLGVIINPFFEELLFRLCLRFTLEDFTKYSILSVSFLDKQVMKRFGKYVTYLWINKFHLIFFFSAIVFAYFHLSNYELSITIVLLSPLLVAPQFITGLFLGYLRVKYSFMLGYSMHAIHNAFFILISLIFIKGI